jgi:WD40 repeat protein
MGEFHEARLVRTVEFENLNMYPELFCIEGGNYLAVDALAHNINVYDTNGTIISQYIGACEGYSFYTVLSDKTLVVGHVNGKLTFWDYKSKRVKLIININTGKVHRIYELDNKKDIFVVSNSRFNPYNKRNYVMQKIGMIQINDAYSYYLGPVVCVKTRDTHSLFTEMSNDSFYMASDTTSELIYKKFDANKMFDPKDNKIQDPLSPFYKPKFKRCLPKKAKSAACNFEKIDGGCLIFGFADGSLMVYDEETEEYLYDQNIHRQSDIVCAEKGVFAVNYAYKGLCRIYDTSRLSIYDWSHPTQDIEGLSMFSVMSRLHNKKNEFCIVETLSRLKFYEICYRFVSIFSFFFFFFSPTKEKNKQKKINK